MAHWQVYSRTGKILAHSSCEFGTSQETTMQAVFQYPINRVRASPPVGLQRNGSPHSGMRRLGWSGRQCLRSSRASPARHGACSVGPWWTEWAARHCRVCSAGTRLYARQLPLHYLCPKGTAVGTSASSLVRVVSRPRATALCLAQLRYSVPRARAKRAETERTSAAVSVQGCRPFRVCLRCLFVADSDSSCTSTALRHQTVRPSEQR
jgi:hypothetical protein